MVELLLSMCKGLDSIPNIKKKEDKATQLGGAVLTSKPSQCKTWYDPAKRTALQPKPPLVSEDKSQGALGATETPKGLVAQYLRDNSGTLLN